MFGGNSIVGKKYFNEAEEAKQGKLLVTSMFMTLQGEGPLRGEPAFFVRLSKCNLACSFCDTYFDQGEWLSIEEIEVKINQIIQDFFKGNVPKWAEYIPGKCLPEAPTDGTFAVNFGDRDGGQKWFTQAKKRKIALVITGGEPTLQDNLGLLLEWGRLIFHKTQIESNGIMLAKSLPLDTILVVSPKCREGSNAAYLKPNSDMLERADCLKFVMEADQKTLYDNSEEDLSVLDAISAEPDSPYSSIPDWAHEWAEKTGRPVFCSPMNIYRQEPQKAKDLRARTTETTIEERSLYDEVISFWEEGLLDMKANQINHEYTANYAIRHGFVFGVQIHLLASVA